MVKTVKIVFENMRGLYRWKHSGSPRMEYKEEQNIDFDEQVEISWNSDTAPSQGWKGSRFEIREITIPDYIEVEFYINNYIKIQYLSMILRASKINLIDLEEQTFKDLLRIYTDSGILCYAITKLLGSKPKSEFRKSLKSQLISWIETPKSERKYDKPFSYKQQHCLCNTYIQRDYDCLVSNFSY